MYKVNPEECIGCGVCQEECPTGAIEMSSSSKAVITDACIECGTCLPDCPVHAISE